MHALRAPVAFDGTRFLAAGATLLIEGSSIVGVEPMGFTPPAGCPVTSYDGTILPGLIDAHVHLVSSGAVGALEAVGGQTAEEIDAEIARSLAAQAAHGVTTVRDLGDRDYRTLAFRDRAATGQPRIVAAGPPITVPDGHCYYLGCTAAGGDDLRAAVAAHHDRGVDAIKVMASGGFLTPGTDLAAAQYTAEDLRVVVDEAHALGLAVLAHAHSLAGTRAAVLAGVDGIEHATGIAAGRIEVSDDILVAIARADVAVDPTMGNDLDLFAQMPAPPPQMAAIMAQVGLRSFDDLQEIRLRDVRRMREHGIRVVPGVDAGAAPIKQHGNAWRAVLDLVTAGFPVHEALAAGTSVAAEACGVGAVTGRLQQGYDADLLVVDGDLAQDPGALARPSAVLVRGERVPTSRR